jgi:hypothetical protein
LIKKIEEENKVEIESATVQGNDENDSNKMNLVPNVQVDIG